jgi:hypothetical protein
MDASAWFSKHRSLWLGLAVLCVPCPMLAGCKQGESRVPTFPASGQLLAANDKPIANALVVLHPVDINSEAPKSRATTDADGKFQLTTYITGDGAPEGDFIVTVEQWLRDDPNEAPSNKIPGTWSRPESSQIRIAILKSANQLAPIRLR